MKQQPGQFVQNFYSDMVCLWDEIAELEPWRNYLSEVEKFYAYRDSHRLILFLIALLDDCDSTRTTILNRKPLPSFDSALKDLISEETRRYTTSPRSADMVLATPHQTNSTS